MHPIQTHAFFKSNLFFEPNSILNSNVFTSGHILSMARFFAIVPFIQRGNHVGNKCVYNVHIGMQNLWDFI